MKIVNPVVHLWASHKYEPETIMEIKTANPGIHQIQQNGGVKSKNYCWILEKTQKLKNLKNVLAGRNLLSSAIHGRQGWRSFIPDLWILPQDNEGRGEISENPKPIPMWFCHTACEKKQSYHLGPLVLKEG